MRTIICHYHIFKNSGSSFDALLRKNYGDRHICFDGPFPFFTVDQEQLSKIIDRKPEIVACSSHQILLPVPTSLNHLVLPVVFIRHPLLRALSIYEFKKKIKDGTITSDNARSMPFDQWVTHCLDHPSEVVHISNMQTRMLGAAYRQTPVMRRHAYGMEYDFHQALRNLANVELLARTEYYAQDVSRFPALLESYGIEFEYTDMAPVNVTGTDHSLPMEERVALLQEKLAKPTFDRLVKANGQDMALFEATGKRIDADR